MKNKHTFYSDYHYHHYHHRNIESRNIFKVNKFSKYLINILKQLKIAKKKKFHFHLQNSIENHLQVIFICTDF